MLERHYRRLFSRVEPRLLLGRNRRRQHAEQQFSIVRAKLLG
jgi:hypothetical protein